MLINKASNFNSLLLGFFFIWLNKKIKIISSNSIVFLLYKRIVIKYSKKRSNEFKKNNDLSSFSNPTSMLINSQRILLKVLR